MVLPVAGGNVERGVVLAAAVEREVPAEEQTVGSATHGDRARQQALVGGVRQIHGGEEDARGAGLDRAVIGVDLNRSQWKGKRGTIGWRGSEATRREPASRDGPSRLERWSARRAASGQAPQKHPLFLE